LSHRRARARRHSQANRQCGDDESS
jgi:hypothetical protein